jgi:ComF family protein
MSPSVAELCAALRRWADAVSHLLFPKVCAACGAADGAGDGVLCRPCRAQMGRLRRAAYCRRCGRSVGPHAAREPCARCPQADPPIAAVVRVGEYAPPLSGLIAAFKYAGRDELADALGDRAARALRTLPAAMFEAVVPVPLHPRRRRQRGYDQAALLAAAIARRIKKPVLAALVRIRDTPPQVGATAAQRRRNVAGAFAQAAGADVAGRRLLLVDDVTTTGATAFEAARTLRRADAAEVTLVVAAVAGLPVMRPTEGPPDDSPGPAGDVTEDPL